MEITGRITADSVVHKVSNDKQVVNFSIAINDNYKPKGSTEVKEVVTYIYSNHEGKPIGSLTFHTNNIKILAFAKKTEQTENGVMSSIAQGMKSETADDLPF